MKTIETFVEARIIRVSLDQARAGIEIELLSGDGRKRWRIVSSGVDDFLAEGLRINSIVDEVLVYGAEDVGDEDLLAKLYWLLTGKESTSGGYNEPFFQARLQLVVSGELTFWTLLPIYGGQIFILAKNVVFHEELIS